MDLLRIGTTTYNLQQMVRAREVEKDRPLPPDTMNPHHREFMGIPRPEPERYRVLQLWFSDGKGVTLDERQTDEFRAIMASGAPYRALSTPAAAPDDE